MAMNSDRLALSVAEASRAIGISERTLRKMVALQQVRVVRIGRRVLIPAQVLRELLELQTEAADDEQRAA